MSDPQLDAALRETLVAKLMAARRALRRDAPVQDRASALKEVDVVKQALGERGAVWWTDGAPDMNRKLVRNTPYNDWFESLQG